MDKSKKYQRMMNRYKKYRALMDKLPRAATGDEMTEEIRRKIPWLITEDFMILETITKAQMLPIDLNDSRPGRTPNWEFAAEAVNSLSVAYKTPDMCMRRYTSHIMPREQGNIITELDDYREMKKMDGSLKFNFKRAPKKKFAPLDTRSLMKVENNVPQLKGIQERCAAMRHVSNQRAPTAPPFLHSKRFVDNTEVLRANNIVLDKPLTPQQLSQSLRRKNISSKDDQTKSGQLYLTEGAMLDSGPVPETAGNQEGMIGAGIHPGGNVGERRAGEQLAGGQLARGQPAGGTPAGGRPAGGQFAGGQLAGRQLAGRQLAGGQIAGRQLAGGPIAGRQLAGEERAGEDRAGELAGEEPYDDEINY